MKNIKLNLEYASEDLKGIENLPKGSIVLYKSQTGTGKTTAIIGDREHNIKGLKDKIGDKTIIYLCNRWALKNQVKLNLCTELGVEIEHNEDGSINYNWLNKLKTIGNVTILSYQEIQKKVYESDRIKYKYSDWYLRDGIFSLGDYDYIVADEFHYIVRDAGFNSETMISYRELVKTWYDKSVTILLTATDGEVKIAIENSARYLEELTNSKEYIKAYGENAKRFSIDNHYKYIDGGIDYSYVNPFYYNNKKDMITTIKNSNANEKWIWFISNIEKGEILLEELKKNNIEADIVTSNDNSELKKYIIENERFECKVLITTSVLDNGVNIKDDDVTNIIIESFDKVTFIQMLGRKRIDKNNAQKINLYIPKRNSSHYTKKIEGLKKKCELINLFLNDKEELKRVSDYNQGILQGAFYRDFDETLLLNNMYLVRITNDEFYYKQCSELLDADEWFFVKEQLRWIGLESAFSKDNLIENVTDNEEIKTLENYLNEIVGKKLFDVEQQELSNLIIKELITVKKNIDYRTKKLKPGTIEKLLREDLNLEYAIIENKKESKGEMRGKRYIILGKII